MMVSPEWYYAVNLKGKTAAQIQSHICSLQQEICQLQNQADHADPEVRMICPSPDVQLEMCRLYLQKAKAALADAQGDKFM